MKEPRDNPADGPMQDRRSLGEAKPERSRPSDAGSDTPDQQGIEIDHEKDRPQPRLN